MGLDSNTSKLLKIYLTSAMVGVGAYGAIALFAGKKPTDLPAAPLSPRPAAGLAAPGFRLPAGRTDAAQPPTKLLTTEEQPLVIGAVKKSNSDRGRSPAVEAPATTDATLLARHRAFLRDQGFGDKIDSLKTYFGNSAESEVLAIAAVLSGNADLTDQAREIQQWANVKIFANATGSTQILGAVLAKPTSRELPAEREWAISVLYSLGQTSETARKDVRTTLLAEVNRQGIQSLEGMSTLVRILRIQRSSQWVSEVQKEFEEMNPGTDLAEYVALTKD